jgi:exopolyphosphatase/guanosine-5'-triphosphate,3'-diphosphate pyrophosphatase
VRYSTFAAIYIGTYDVTMEVFEISKSKGILSIDKIRKHLEIATDTYATGKISEANIRALISILQSFKLIAKEYQVEKVRAIAGSSIRDAENNIFIIGQIREEIGLDVELLSNSEQRYLSFKAIISSDPKIMELMEAGTAVIDVAGGSIQVSIFDHGRLNTTLNLRIGSLRVRDRLLPIQTSVGDYPELVEEYISHELHTFREVHLQGRKFESVIVNGDFMTESLMRVIENGDSHVVSRKRFDRWYNDINACTDDELAVRLNIPAEFASILRPTAILYHKFVEEIGAQKIYASGVSLSRGVAYEYAEKTKKMKSAHSFEDDILGAANELAHRYRVEEAHVKNVEVCALAIFDAIRKRFGLTQRDRLLIRIAVMLHEVGKYISLNNNGACAYQIITYNEIIGLSHEERKLIAYVVMYNTCWLPGFESFTKETGYDGERYLRIAKLTAILRLANELDRSHRQKVKNIRVRLTDEVLKIRVSVDHPFALEQNLIRKQITFFKYIFNIDIDLHVTRIS